MECNKDEAIRAKHIAEKKMENNDFEGARRIALKAQNLYPDLENISQLLSVCDVHCSAQRRMIGSEKDWYGILRIEKLADELTIKKQYRRLALFLHPDKNQFPGAEAAFKLICEANAVLSDPTKKSLYDSKIRVTVRSASVYPPPHHLNRNSQFNKQYGSQNNVFDGFSSFNQRQTTQTSFWTSCPFCSMKYEYQRKFVNTILRCPKCLKNFMGYETGMQGFPLGSTCAPPSARKVPVKPGVSQTSGFQGKGVPSEGKFTMGNHNVLGSSASHFGYQQSAYRKTVHSEPGVRTESVPQATPVAGATKVGGDMTSTGTGNSGLGEKCSGDENKKERAGLKNRSRKRGRKPVDKSSDSCDTSSESDDLGNPANNLSSEPGHIHFPRRSTRKRKNVSYLEGDDDDLPSHPTRLQGRNLSEDTVNEQNALDDEDSKHENQDGKEMGTVCPEETLQDKDAGCAKEAKKTGERNSMLNNGADPIEIESDSDLNSYPKDGSNDDICLCPDPEFYDFDKDRDERCFAVNQFWACYDAADSMPRYYAKVKKLCHSPFELSITWLEADPIDEAYKKWIDKELPVGCGRFKLGKTEKTSVRFMFSHQVHCDKGKKRGSLIIYPRLGEVWALFKDWDLSWSSHPEHHKENKYEVVEVLSEFDAFIGIKVCHLDKVEGFVSLFERSSQTQANSFLVGSNELYKFSHRIPCCKMTGSEREGVPVGSFELDPASLPLNPDDLHYPGKARMETKNLDPVVNFAQSKSAMKGDFVKSERNDTPIGFVDLEGD